jgi:hypothetical protein
VSPCPVCAGLPYPGESACGWCLVRVALAEWVAQGKPRRRRRG